MRWNGKQTQDALYKREKCFAVISLAQAKKQKNFVQLYESRSRNFTILKSRESESNGNKARESE